MRIRHVIVAGLAAGLLASAGAADEAQPAQPSDETPRASAKEPDARLGEQEYKERINVVARKPYRHDITWLDGRDRASWHQFTTWQGIRDERPLVARKVLGFHVPDPHVRRAERVERISRGPLRGPAPSE